MKIGKKVQRKGFLMLNFKLEEIRDYVFVVMNVIMLNINVKLKNRESYECLWCERIMKWNYSRR